MTGFSFSPRETAHLYRRRIGRAKWWIAFIIAVLIGIAMNCLASKVETPVKHPAPAWSIPLDHEAER